MRALVTGAGGFLGSWTVQALRATGAEVIGTVRPVSASASPPAETALPLSPLDVRDRAAVRRVVEASRPDVVYHLAGQAGILPSWEDPFGTIETNVLGTLNVLEALRESSSGSRLLFAGSGTEYGNPETLPTPETAPLRPQSPYAASKAAADLLCYQYYTGFGIPVLRCRIFATTGPGRLGDPVNDFASQIAAAERAGRRLELGVGDLDKARDVTDVRDTVRALLRVAEVGTPGEAYNVGSGVARKVGDMLAGLVALSKVPVAPRVDAARVRTVDEPVRLADIARLSGLGWMPQIPFEKTLSDTLDYWRDRSLPEVTPHPRRFGTPALTPKNHDPTENS